MMKQTNLMHILKDGEKAPLKCPEEQNFTFFFLGGGVTRKGACPMHTSDKPCSVVTGRLIWQKAVEISRVRCSQERRCNKEALN